MIRFSVLLMDRKIIGEGDDWGILWEYFEKITLR